MECMERDHPRLTSSHTASDHPMGLDAARHHNRRAQRSRRPERPPCGSSRRAPRGYARQQHLDGLGEWERLPRSLGIAPPRCTSPGRLRRSREHDLRMPSSPPEAPHRRDGGRTGDRQADAERWAPEPMPKRSAAADRYPRGLGRGDASRSPDCGPASSHAGGTGTGRCLTTNLRLRWSCSQTWYIMRISRSGSHVTMGDLGAHHRPVVDRLDLPEIAERVPRAPGALASQPGRSLRVGVGVPVPVAQTSAPAGMCPRGVECGLEHQVVIVEHGDEVGTMRGMAQPGPRCQNAAEAHGLRA